MAEKRQIRRTLKDLQRVKTWQLVILLILAGFIAATFLRLNNIGMVERRAAVIAADEAGDQTVITQRLYDLQRYVSSHMNTDLGNGVPLQASYQRDYEKAVEQASKSSSSSGNVYDKARQVCDPQFSNWSQAYVECFTSEVAKYPSGEELQSQIKEPDRNLYMYSYASPLWSPDFAGWSLVVCAVLVLLIIVRLVSVGVLRLLLRRHYKSI